MPLTRSQKEKGVPLGASSSALQHTEQLSERPRSEGSASEMNSEATAPNVSSKTSIRESPGTTETKTRSIEKGDRLKQLNMAEVKNRISSLATLIPGGSTRTSVKSVRTTRSAARLRELEVKEKIAELQLIEAEAKLARISLEKQRIEDSSSEDDLENEQEDRTSHDQNCIQTSPMEDMKHNILPELDLQGTDEKKKEERIVKTEKSLMNTIQVQKLEGEILEEQRTEDSVLEYNLDNKLENRALHAQNFIQTFPEEEIKSNITPEDQVIVRTERSLMPTSQVQRLAGTIKEDQGIEDTGSEDDLSNEVEALNDQDCIKTSLLECGKDNFIPEQDLEGQQVIGQPLTSTIQVQILSGFIRRASDSHMTDANAHEDEKPADLLLMTQFLIKQRDKSGAYAPTDKQEWSCGRVATHTAKEEDEGGGVFTRPHFSGADSIAMSEDWCYAQGGDRWRLD